MSALPPDAECYGSPTASRHRPLMPRSARCGRGDHPAAAGNMARLQHSRSVWGGYQRSQCTTSSNGLRSGRAIGRTGRSAG